MHRSIDALLVAFQTESYKWNNSRQLIRRRVIDKAEVVVDVYFLKCIDKFKWVGFCVIHVWITFMCSGI